MHFESVAEKHVLSLLEFERNNKSYFEKSIAPREAAFYSINGVGNHVSELRYLQQQERAWGYVLVDKPRNNQIIARANIKNRQGNRAEIGYRVAQKESGKGIASRSVLFLIDEARSLGITTLCAEVMDNNPASEKVLIKSGFNPTLCFYHKYLHQGVLYNSTHFELSL
ncbi:N-acetyltransferase [Alteromonas sp. BL110]|uniref:GNAT family N-acetyltransferase n=1 Tax=Alteromonas sp. BL110 TaxID=1714845 RepID=UPI000E469C3D|nr:GNAT family N-acetyltransferase [Alteromonas sp. BL110]AXT40418.1 N-acetyltransferase [Alteromonas sp. BL110]RKM79650.1 GNAT family N-acetyltransferase [Alteromonas sp. BL110]